MHMTEIKGLKSSKEKYWNQPLQDENYEIMNTCLEASVSSSASELQCNKKKTPTEKHVPFVQMFMIKMQNKQFIGITTRYATDEDGMRQLE